MTTQSQTDDTDLQPEEVPVYRFEPKIIEEQGRSVQIVLGERLCDAAKAKLSSPDGVRGMSIAEVRKLFRDTCAKQEGYLEPQQPVLEAVLRMLLTNKVDGLDLERIHQELSELWMTSPWPRYISIESLHRVLDNAGAYGIVQA